MDYPSFFHSLCELFILDGDVVDNEDLLIWIMGLGEPSFSSILLMKDKGNLIFRQGNFSLASSLYKQALNFLCYIGLLLSSDHHSFSSLALSLVLNLAACELKISHFDLASRYCKFVLHFDPSNVKALYRRGLAYKKLNLLKDAHDDFEQVLKLDLNNSEAKRELLDVTDQLAVNLNGRRTAYLFDPLGSIFRGKKPLLHKGVVDYTDEASCSSSIIAESASAEDFLGLIPMALDTACETDLTLVVENTELSTPFSGKSAAMSSSMGEPNPPLVPKGNTTASTFTPKPSKFTFLNKRQSKRKLHISCQDYDNLILRKDLCFFHPESLSFLRVRPLTSKTIQTGTPHEESSRVAEVPIPAPAPKERDMLSSTISSTIPENTEMFQEEDIIQIEKKKRLSSGSSLASKVSGVQFQFVASHTHSSNEFSRVVDYSHRRSRVVQARANLRKRALFFVGFSYVLCRYTWNGALARRTKRKKYQFFHFDEQYHPPLKKVSSF